MSRGVSIFRVRFPHKKMRRTEQAKSQKEKEKNGWESRESNYFISRSLPQPRSAPTEGELNPFEDIYYAVFSTEPKHLYRCSHNDVVRFISISVKRPSGRWVFEYAISVGIYFLFRLCVGNWIFFLIFMESTDKSQKATTTTTTFSCGPFKSISSHYICFGIHLFDSAPHKHMYGAAAGLCV